MARQSGGGRSSIAAVQKNRGIRFARRPSVPHAMGHRQAGAQTRKPRCCEGNLERSFRVEKSVSGEGAVGIGQARRTHGEKLRSGIGADARGTDFGVVSGARKKGAALTKEADAE